MVESFCYKIGIDYSMVTGHRKLLKAFVFCLIFVFVLTFVGFFYALTNSTESFILSLFISVFFTLIVFNIYRLVFSSSEGELNKYDTYKNVSFFILKRGLILILLSIAVAKSLGVLVFEKNIKYYLNNHKLSLIEDFNRTLELNRLKERQSIENEFQNKIRDDILFNRVSETRTSIFLDEKEKKLIAIEEDIILKNKIFKVKIDNTNFFITKVRLLSTEIPSSWFFTILIVSIFLLPIYMILVTPIFKDYDLNCENISKKIILDEYEIFKKNYVALITSVNNDFEYHEKFTDPPFNTIKIKSKIKILKKGSLLKWIQKFDLNE